MAEPTPLTDEEFEELAVWFSDDWHGRQLVAEVRRLRAERAERAELSGLLNETALGWDTTCPDWNRLCELFPELKETP